MLSEPVRCLEFGGMLVWFRSVSKIFYAFKKTIEPEVGRTFIYLYLQDFVPGYAIRRAHSMLGASPQKK